MKSCMRWLTGASLAGLFALLGCAGGNPNAASSMSGKVTYKGEPVGGGTVRLDKEGATQKEGNKMSMNLSPDGTFNGTDIADGEYTVEIETESAKGNAPTDYKGKKMQSSPIPQTATVVKATYVAIPKKYAKKDTSGLKIKLEKGKNEKNFDLTD